MNLKKIFSTGLLLALFFITGVVNAQVGTYYVNNATGNDANSGLLGSPKATVSSALQAAPTGSTISVAFTGINYAEPTPGMNLVPGPLTPGVTGTYTFTSTGGTPVFTSLFQLGTAATAGTLTFTGPFQFNGLSLINGTIAGGDQITITTGAVVTRTEVGSITSGQLAFAGTASFIYVDAVAAASNITVGLEFPTATTVATNLTLTATVANLTLTLNSNRTINGILNTDGDAGANTGTLALSTFTLTINGTNAHFIDGDVTGANGTLAFVLTGAASLDGLNAARSITNLSVSSVAANTLTIDPAGLSTISTVGNVDVNGAAGLTMQNTGNIGNITHNGSGAVTTAQTSPGTVGNVLMSSTATNTASITLNTAGAAGTMNTGTVTQSGQGLITFGANVTVAVNTGNVLLNTTFAFTNAAAQTNQGLITFDNAGGGGLAAVVITGTLQNTASFTGVSNDAGNTNNGVILFANTGAVTVTGTTTVFVTSTVVLTAPGTFVTGGNIAFSAAAGIGTFGAINNTSTIDMGSPAGTIYTSAGAATFAGGFTTGAITNSSLNSGVAGRGDIEFQDVTAAFNIASITQSAAALGGDILLGNANLVVTTNISNARTVAGADIVWGTASVGANTVTAVNIINSGSSNITFTRTLTGNVTLTGTLSLTGSGNITFPGATTAVFAMPNLTVNGTGTLDFGDQTVVAAQGNVNVTGNAQFINGTVDMGQNVGGARLVTLSGAAIQLGGASSRVTFTNATTTTIDFGQPIPNVNQIVTLGTFNQTYSGPITVTNAAVLPAPFVIFQSVAGATGTPGSLTLIGNNLTFNTGAIGNVNTVQLNNARFYVGTNNPGGSAGNFQNTTGYSTTNGGFVMMQGNALQTVNAGAINAGATFGNFGVANNSGLAPAVTFNTAGSIMTSDFYLALGQVRILNLVFGVAAAAAPYPTIFRTEGTFDLQLAAANLPNFVNVTYYGGDKATANEIPNATLANFLFNLTVATTNGASAGQGIIGMAAAATVNGTLTINVGQSLFTGANVLTLAGASAVVNGNLVDNGVTQVQLACPTGTTFTGTGTIPGLQVNGGSVGNVIATKGLVSNGFGGDGVWGGAADDFTTMDGSINFAAGVASSLTATFTAPTAPSTTNFFNLTTVAGSAGTFTLGANAIMGGNMTHAAGTIALGDFTLDHQGVTPGMTGGALITSNAAGKLFFQTLSPTFTVTAPAATIGANVEFSGDTQTLTIPAASANLTITGNLTLTDKSAAAGGATLDIGAGRTLTAAGANVTVGANCAFTATAGGTTGILLLDVAAPNTLLTWNTPANSSVTNLTINDNVALAGGIIGSTLTVGQAAAGAFIHSAGDLNFGTTNLQIGNANATPFNRTGATTYSGTGYMIWNSTGAFNHSTVAGAGAMTINKFRTLLNLPLVNPRGLVVVQNLDVLNSSVFTNNVAGVGYLTVGDATNVPVITLGENAAGDPNIATNAPIFGNADVDYIFTDAAGVGNGFTVTTTVWPTAQAARNVTVNTAAGVTNVTLGANRTITTALNLTQGGLVWDSPTAITLNSGVLITRNAGGFMTRDASGGGAVGSLNAILVDLRYTNAVGNTGEEYSLPTEVRNVTLGLPAGTAVAINATKTITGVITWNSTLTFNTPTVTNVTLAQTLPGTSQVIVNAGATVNWNGGLTVNSTLANAYNNNGTTTGNISGTGNITNTGALNLTGLNHSTGLFTMNPASTITMTGNAVFGPINVCGNLTYNVAVPPLMPTITTPNDLTFVGVWGNVAATGAGAYLNLVFTGANNQAVALGANRNFQNITLNKTSDGTVTLNGGNVTLNAVVAPAAPGIGIPAGMLTLTRGILEVPNPNLLTLQVTVTGGIITNLGYVRNPANTTDLAHLIGRLGVAIPAGTIGRSEWPVGSLTRYRPAAITFTAGNATIAPTTIIVSHVNQQPITPQEVADGNRPEFPLDGGTKVLGGANPIGSATPYYWLFEATTSLGAAQLMNVELNGTDVPVVFPSLGNRNHNDLRIIKRFDGNVAANRYNVEGSNDTYTNALYENTPVTGQFLAVVRNLGSLGSAISQRAIFTIGLPSQAPIFNVANVSPVAMTEATGTVLNVHTSNHAATDPDVATTACTYGYTVTPALPAGATAAISNAGVFTFTPGWNGGSTAGTAYTFVITATKADGTPAVRNLVVTVTNTDRAPVFATPTATVNPATATTGHGIAKSVTYTATDADGEAVTYTYAVAPVPAGTVTLVAGLLTFTPTFADVANSPFVFTVTASSGTPVMTAVTTTSFAVTNSGLLGDVDLDGFVTTLDALLVLNHVVNPTVYPLPLAQQRWAADVKVDGVIGAYDAASILVKAGGGNFLPKDAPAAGTVEFGTFTADKGVFTLPINVKNTSGVKSVYSEIQLGNAVEFTGVNGKLPEGWVMTSNFENGTLKIAMAGLTPLTDGSIAFVNLSLKDKEASVSVQGSTIMNDQIAGALNAVKVKEIPSEFSLSQNYPNPFNPTTSIKYAISENARVTLTIYNVLGQVVRTLVNAEQESGYYTVRWDGTNDFGGKVSSGIYIYRISAGSFTSTVKMNLLK